MTGGETSAGAVAASIERRAACGRNEWLTRIGIRADDTQLAVARATATAAAVRGKARCAADLNLWRVESDETTRAASAATAPRLRCAEAAGAARIDDAMNRERCGRDEVYAATAGTAVGGSIALGATLAATAHASHSGDRLGNATDGRSCTAT